MKCQILLTLLTSSLVSALMYNNLMAANVSGTIVNQTWTSNNSAYQVVGNILVAGLTIKSGVTVIFTGNYNFEVAGVLRAKGMPAAPIVFMGTNGGWQGIYFNDSGPSSVLAYCVISNSVNSGIRILSTAPVIEDCLIANNSAPVSGGGIQVSNLVGGDITLENCVIRACLQIHFV